MDKYEVILQMAANIIAPGNRFTVSSLVEDSVRDVLINKYNEDWKGKKDLFLQAYDELRNKFHLANYHNDVPYFYSMYYMPLNIPKVQTTFLDLLRRKKLPKQLRILDVGSSVGTTAIAIMDLITLIDSLSILIDAEPLFEKIDMSFIEGSPDNINIFKQNISYFKSRLDNFSDASKINITEPKNIDISMNWDIEGEFDVIIFSNILNELSYDERKKAVMNSIYNLSNDGNIIIIEPANRGNAENLNRLKYDIVTESGFNCIAPCGASETCKSCWMFRAENTVLNGLVKYIDEIYAGNIDSDEFFNERLKWNYAILSRSKPGYNITGFNTIDLDTITDCSFYVVSNHSGNQYRVCDGQCGRDLYFLDTSEYQVDKLNFGDTILAQNACLVKQGDKIFIKLNKSSKLKNIFGIDKSAKLIITKVEEHSLRYILKRQWGFNDFREGQFEIIKRALLDIDTIGILPTGAGKSLCFQLPAMLKTGVSIVVSPLKSLMKDQIDNLLEIGFEYVDYIDGSRTTQEKKEILKRFKGGFLKLLYVSPERLQIKEFQNELINTLNGIAIDYFIIDEAHCASEWGHDFRPSYMKIIDAKNKLNNPTLIALTATASPRVRKDISEIFHIKEENTLLPRTFDRPEISLQVKKVDIYGYKEVALAEVINEDIPSVLGACNIEKIHENGSGIIFTIYGNPKGTNTRKNGAEYISSIVNEIFKLQSSTYYGELGDEIRVERQNRFKKDETHLLVATKGFGMGIDKPNIDYIIHMCYCNSLEAYYQEAGRAGRDGEHAHAITIARTRHPNCLLQSSGPGRNEPMCANAWVCSFTNGDKCDYGMQAKFIEKEYPSVKEMTQDISYFINYLRARAGSKLNFSITLENKNSAKNQKYLYYLQKYGVVKDYNVERYILGAGFDLELNVILNKSLGVINTESIILKIVNDLQEFKKQKYSMLQSMWEYVDSKICRRQFLMNYFGDSANYNEGCHFCDIEGFSEDRAVQVRTDERLEKIYEELKDLFITDEFNYERIFILKETSYKENIQENIKIRAMKVLEDYPNNKTALYLTGFISFERDINEVYGRNQIFNCIEILNKKGDISNAACILSELCDIDENYTFELSVQFGLFLKNIDLLDKLINTFEDTSKKQYLYKSYLNNKLDDINEVLLRGRK